MLESMVTAFRTLTIIPVPGCDSTRPAMSLPLFPLVGAFIGTVLYLAARGSALLFPGESLIGGLVVTVIMVLITGALHIDGLADIADAFGGGRTREKVLGLLKDSRHGTFGVTAIVCSLAGRMLLTAWCIDHRHYLLLIVSAVFSRTVQAWGCSLAPYAISDASGGGSVYFSGKYRAPLAVTTITAVVIGGWFLGPVSLAGLILVSLIPAVLFFAQCVKKINGLTGDCLGAVNEIAELSILFFGAGFASSFGEFGCW